MVQRAAPGGEAPHEDPAAIAANRATHGDGVQFRGGGELRRGGLALDISTFHVWHVWHTRVARASCTKLKEGVFLVDLDQVCPPFFFSFFFNVFLQQHRDCCIHVDRPTFCSVDCIGRHITART